MPRLKRSSAHASPVGSCGRVHSRTSVPALQSHLLEGELPFSEPFQVIFCRNVMIYFDRPTQEELVRKLGRWLVPGGYLFVGHSENFTDSRQLFRLRGKTIYERV